MESKSLIDLEQFSLPDLDEILRLACDIRESPSVYAGALRGKIMGTLFYEPSTRTQMSFQSAMLRLGGGLIGFDNPAVSSVSKGENLKDTTKIVSGYSDIMVMRHPQEGAVKAAALTADCPVINAGDGGHLHPTQTLSDLLTLRCEKKRLNNLTIGVCGDLLHGRTVHSLVKALSKYDGNRFVLISAAELRLPDYVKEHIIAEKKTFRETDSLSGANTLGELDVLYMTRIQQERFPTEADYLRQKGGFILDAEKMRRAGPNMLVLHPLPRVDEIAMEVDDDPRALYFKQANYGMYVRMALILKILSTDISRNTLLKGEVFRNITCRNGKCITRTENYLPKSFIRTGNDYECEYCETVTSEAV